MPAHATRPLHLAAAPDGEPARVTHTCGCGWTIVRPPGMDVEMEACAHRVQTHTTSEQRTKIALLRQAWTDFFTEMGQEFPPHLLMAIVAKVLTEDDQKTAVAA